jgi:hypothetical protein
MKIHLSVPNLLCGRNSACKHDPFDLNTQYTDINGRLP